MTLNQSSCLSMEEIQDYLTNRADDALRFRVEDHLLDCPLCAAAMEGYSANIAQAPDSINQELEALRARMQERLQEEVPAPRIVIWNRVAAAAMIALALGAAWMYWHHTEHERLYAGVFRPMESDLLSLRGEADAVPAEKAAPLRLYDAGRFEEALPLFVQYLEAQPADFYTALYGGIAAVEAEQYELAQTWLENVRFNAPEYYAEATWYLALAHLRAGERKECMALLEELQEAKDADWAEQAANLLKKMR